MKKPFPHDTASGMDDGKKQIGGSADVATWLGLMLEIGLRLRLGSWVPILPLHVDQNGRVQPIFFIFG